VMVREKKDQNQRHFRGVDPSPKTLRLEI
jgi:hypothetical protein